jgi:ketosteroid isomerase-like protein
MNSEVARLSEEANVALVQGDIDGYLARIVHAPDYTLMAPFGGATEHGFKDSPERRAAMKQFFKSGALEQEVIATYESGDLVVLVTVEHARARVGDLPEQDWTLRVTQVFRRAGAGWQLAHRHADPLGPGISVEQAAKLARGDA